VPDTLDWRLYYPLAVGHVWEYMDDNFPLLGFPRYERREIVADTVLGGDTYLVQRTRSYDTGLQVTYERHEFLRYDTTGRRIVHLQTEGCCPGAYEYPTCGLAEAFDQTIECGAGVRVHLSGGYDENGPVYVSGDAIRVKAVKHFCFAGPCISLAHGVGDIGGVPEGGNNTISLIYVRLDGAAYGASVVATSSEPAADRPGGFGLVAVYPSPTAGRAVVAYREPSGSGVLLEVFDLLGRRVWHRRQPAAGPGPQHAEVDGTGWAAGVYLVRATADDGRHETRRLVLHR
jgi:hypothetical protein